MRQPEDGSQGINAALAQTKCDSFFENFTFVNTITLELKLDLYVHIDMVPIKTFV